MNNFGQMTEEQRKEALSKAMEARTIKAEERKNNAHNLKQDYLDAPNWAALASKYKVRMPNNADPVTSGSIAKYCRKLGISNDTFNEHYTSRAFFIKNNPKWSQYAMAGLLLELKEYA